MEQLTDEIVKVETANSEAHEKGDIAESECAGIRAQLKTHGTQLLEIEEKIELLEIEKRCNILVIDGLEAKIGERVIEVVSRIFKDLELAFDAEMCTGIYRRGKNPGDKRDVNKDGAEDKTNPSQRPLVIIFPTVAEKASVFRNLKNLIGKEEWRRVFINDDLTETQANEQRDLRALAAFAKSKGYNTRARAGILELEGRKFRYHELNRLPEDLSLIKAKTLFILKDKAVVFQSQHSPLSNPFPCNIIYRGEVFLSSEAAYQYTRGLTREAQLIKLERRAYKVKLKARNAMPTREWDESSEQIMREILIEKFTRNKFCMQFLLNTGNRALFEGTGDRFWGCGLPIS